MQSLIRVKSIAWLLFLYLPSMAQEQITSDVVRYLQKVNNAYSHATSLQFSIQYNVYSSASSVAPVETTRGMFYKKELSYAWIMDGQHVVQNKKYFITADKDNQSILVGNPVTRSAAFLPVALDSLIQFASDYRMADKGSDKEIQFTFKQGLDNVSGIDLRINSASGFISRLVLYYNNFVDSESDPLVSSSPRLEMIFTEISAGHQIADTLFSEKPFFSVKEGKIVLANDFRDYFLIDQRF